MGGAHWYRPDGTLIEVADLLLARKEGLYPSVTTVLAILDKPGLDAAKVRAAERGELEETLARWDAAADVGTRLHAHISEWIAAKKAGVAHQHVVHDPAYDTERAVKDALIIAPTVDWMLANIDWEKPVYSEQSYSHPSGFGGTVDLHCTGTDGRKMIVDMKTKDVKRRPQDDVWFDPMALQLAGYQELTGPLNWKIGDGGGEPDRWVSLIINRDERRPLCHAHEWAPDDQVRACFAWRALLDAWRYLKGYYPGEAA